MRSLQFLKSGSNLAKKIGGPTETDSKWKYAEWKTVNFTTNIKY